MGDWVVVLEFSGIVGSPAFELGAVQSLVERLREWHPSGLYDPSRYAVQLHLPADHSEEALRMASSFHEHAAREIGLKATFTRAEVLTLAEFEESWTDERECDATVSPGGAARALISVEVYNATRAMLGVSDREEITAVLVRFVLAVGGQVNVGPLHHSAGMLSVDLSVASDAKIHAVADSFSVAGLILERWLPPLIDDAALRLSLLDRFP